MTALVAPGSRLGGIGRQVERDAQHEGVDPRVARQVLWLPATGLLALAAVFLLSRPAFYWLTEEDRPLEWIQFALCTFTSLLAFATAVRLARRGNGPAAVLLLLLALGSLVLAGEEISWAQRVLGQETPAAIAGLNEQGELNLHNVQAGFPIDDAFKLAEFLICAGGIALSFLTRWQPARIRVPLLRLLAPPLFTVPLFAAMAGYQAAQFLVFPESWDAAARLQEWAEICLYLGLALLTLAVRRTVDVAQARRTPVVLAVAVLAVTVVFAALSASSGIDPGNI